LSADIEAAEGGFDKPGPSLHANLLPDARPASLILRLTPPAALPFVQLARLDRPIGWQLLLAPCWQSAALAGVAHRTGPNLLHLALFLIGAIAMRGAGSTYNDILDRKLDAGVERTRGRPLPSGRVGVRAAVVFMVLQSLVGLAVLLCFNGFSILLGLASLGIVAIYPLMKRVTAWPQAVLGLAFSWGALMGWAATYAGLAAPALFLYASAFCWTIGYDTIYALQDARDDAIVGIKSTARLFGAKVRQGVGIFYFGATLFALLALATAGSGVIGLAGLCFYCLHLAWQLRRVEGATPQMALALFRSNRDAGLILFGALALQGWIGPLLY
jgi:4-hydroxybenzoate polyprenyltransferase